MAYTSWSVVFGEQPSAAKWNLLGSNDASFNDGSGIGAGAILPNHLFASASSLNTHAWDSSSPTWSGMTTGNGTTVGKYIKLGKTVLFSIVFTAGSTSALASSGQDTTFTLPVTSTSATHAQYQPLGMGYYYDTSGGVIFLLAINWNTTTTGLISLIKVNSSDIIGRAFNTDFASVAFGVGDRVQFTGAYQAA